MTLNPFMILEHNLSKRVETNQFSATAILAEKLVVHLCSYITLVVLSVPVPS